MEYFPLLKLSEEIQALVVKRVARNSFQDLYGLKASSKSMKTLAERRGVYHFYDVLSYFAGIPRESVQRIGKLVRSVKWGWGLWHSDEFRQNRAVFVSAYVPSFYSGQCATHRSDNVSACGTLI
ncbi:hypothetical protein F2Q69_00020492 [Brassica cretica]|uniref:F-box domain-containing protein n=1 Tax=Brassica cretica TaxID=69181 RepID=A0A8S9QE73_BRACR|nr:hypothetical protein F2Q69_00020492 [Brassica cretica]